MKKKLKPQVEEGMGKVVEVFALQENTHWSLDTFLTKVILAGIKQFNSYVPSGTPACYMPKRARKHPELKMTKKEEKRMVERWKKDRLKIQRAFELMANDSDLPIAEYPERQRKIKKGLRLFARSYQSLWD